MSSKKNIIIFLSSCRPGRMADRIGKFVKAKVEAGGMNADIFDPKVLKFEVVSTPIHFMQKPEDAPSWMREANEKIKRADGFVITTAEYNSNVPPPLTNMMCHFPPTSYRHRPVGVVSYSIAPLGGIRAQTLVATYIAEIGMIGIPFRIAIPMVQDVISENGQCNDDRINSGVVSMVKELSWYSDALKAQKKVSPPPT